jgi:4-hydroxy-3-methylbut-2-enyl diphosphate reductase
LAKTAGFCMGVRRALDMVLGEAHRGDRPICTYGSLIHNPQVIRMLEARGIRVLRNLDSPLEGTVVIRTHGISPGERTRIKAAGARICDATCPRVARVQGIIRKSIAEGYSVVIVGDKGHPEVEGLLGFAAGRGYLVSGPAEADRLPALDKVCVVAQTTQSQEVFGAIVDRVRARFGEAQVVNTLCDSTARRQAEVAELSGKVEAMIVVGGKESANTTRLTEIARGCGIPAVQVETEDELDPAWLRRFSSVGITAGASTPNWMIARVLDRVESLTASERGVLATLRAWLRFFVKSNMYVALGAGALSYAACYLQGIEPNFLFHFIACFYVFAMHILNHFTDPETIRLNEPARALFYERHRGLLLALGILSAAGGLGLSLLLGFWPFLLLLLLSLLGISYRVKILPAWVHRLVGFRSLREIPGSKDAALALGWTIVTVVFPPFADPQRLLLSPSSGVAFLFVLTIVLIRSLLFDLKDMQGDMMLGKETIPIILGKGRTKALLIGLAIFPFVLLPLAGLLRWASTLSFVLLIPSAYAVLYLYLYRRRIISQGVRAELTVDGSFILTGIVAFLWSRLI